MSKIPFMSKEKYQPLKEVEIQGIKTKYRQLGQGKPLLFLHGHRADTKKWLTLIERLSKDYTVYSPELPGQNCYTPPFPDGVCSMERYANFCVSFCQELGLKKVSVVGASMGGIISIWLSIKNPELISSQTLLWTPIDKKFYTDNRIRHYLGLVTLISKGGIWLKIWRIIVNSNLIRPFIKRDVRKEEYTIDVVDHEVFLWRSVDLLTWSRSLLDILTVNFDPQFQINYHPGKAGWYPQATPSGSLISRTSSTAESRGLRASKINVPTIAVFSTNDRYLDSEKTKRRYQQIFSVLEIRTINSKFHVPKGNLTTEFVKEYEEAFTPAPVLLEQTARGFASDFR